MNSFLDEIFKDNDIIIFGAGQRGKECMELLQKAQVRIRAFWDNDASKYGKNIAEIPIEAPKVCNHVIIVITAWKGYWEIRKQLEDMGYAEHNLISFDELILFGLQEEEKENRICDYPKTLQLPITYLCNFDCVMCGMHHMIGKKDFSAEELGEILRDELFEQVENVGINGGEPFLKNDIKECFEVMIETLPKLKQFDIISNGYFTEHILLTLQEIKKWCNQCGIKLNLAISVDGVYDMQDFHRGHNNAFVNAENTIRRILENRDKYVDYLGVICTITKYNIERINEVVVWAEQIGIEVEYNIATVNERIENQDRVETFSVMSDEHSRMLAMEFFYCQYIKKRKEKYFAIYLFLKNFKRYADCPCMHNEWITVTPDSQVSFCATHSKVLGSALKDSAYKIVEENIYHLQEIKERYCVTCSHYAYNLNGEGIRLLYDDLMKSNSFRVDER